MKAKQIFEKLVDQWPAKVICFVTALLLFFFYQISQMDTKSVPVKLSVVSDGLLIPVSSYPKHVRVTVRTAPENISKITEDGITAVLNISNYVKPGEYNVPVNIDLDPGLLLIDPLEVHVYPDKVLLTLDEKTFAYVPVKPSLAGTLPRGYESGTIIVTPTSLRISGPRSVVEQLKELQTDKVDLDQHSATFAQQVKVIKNNSLINIEDNAAVSVSVEVKAVRQEKEYTGIHIYFMSLPQNLKIAGTVPDVSFRVSGDQPSVESLNVDDYTVQADCSSILQPGEYEIPLVYLLPATLKLEEKSAESVRITVVSKGPDTVHGQKR